MTRNIYFGHKKTEKKLRHQIKTQLTQSRICIPKKKMFKYINGAPFPITKKQDFKEGKNIISCFTKWLANIFSKMGQKSDYIFYVVFAIKQRLTEVIWW